MVAIFDVTVSQSEPHQLVNRGALSLVKPTSPASRGRKSLPAGLVMLVKRIARRQRIDGRQSASTSSICWTRCCW
ncbi:MAG: hypothetical protein U0992_22290 [Planctomycetaceae bacterium]